jgi:hypothetical protein
MSAEVKTIVGDREKLYQEVWARPARTVAQEYGITPPLQIGGRISSQLLPKESVDSILLGFWRIYN